MDIELARKLVYRIELAGESLYYRNLWLNTQGKGEELDWQQANVRAARKMGVLPRYLMILAKPLPAKRPKSSER